MFSASSDITFKDILKEHIELGGRIIRTIPNNASVKDCSGFITVLSNDNEPPVLTLCLQKAGSLDKSIMSTLVFKDVKDYSEFLDRLIIDLHTYFKVENDQ